MTRDFIDSRLEGYTGYDLEIAGEIYVERFWLDLDVLVRNWSRVLTNSFVIRGSSVSAAARLDVDFQMGGVLFTPEEFDRFKFNCARLKERRFAVIEDVGQQSWTEIPRCDFFRFVYPADISWSDISKSCNISYDIYQRPIRAYFVVTEEGFVGKYTNNDCSPPYDMTFLKQA